MKIALILAIFICPLSTFCQSSSDEVLILRDFLWVMNDIQTKVVSDCHLTAKQKKVLLSLNYSIEETNSFGIYSNSDSRLINYNKFSWLSIYRYLISKQIARPGEQLNADYDSEFDSGYNRRKYFNFYNYFLKWLPTNIDVIQHAELDTTLQSEFKEIINSEEFKWQAKKLVTYIYLHEYFHQLQNVNDQKRKISTIKDRNVRDSAELTLEIQCDSFALYKAFEIEILPEDFLEVYNIIETFRNQNTTLDILERRYNYYEMLLRAGKYFDHPYLKFSIGTYYNSAASVHYDLSEFKHKTFNSLSDLKVLAAKKNDVKLFFDIGYSYLSENYTIDSVYKSSALDSSLVFFEKAANCDVSVMDTTALVIKEKSLLFCAKIKELIIKDRSAAIKYAAAAGKISLYFPKDYYEHMIKRLSN